MAQKKVLANPTVLDNGVVREIVKVATRKGPGNDQGFRLVYRDQMGDDDVEFGVDSKGGGEGDNTAKALDVAISALPEQIKSGQLKDPLVVANGMRSRFGDAFTPAAKARVIDAFEKGLQRPDLVALCLARKLDHAPGATKAELVALLIG